MLFFFLVEKSKLCLLSLCLSPPPFPFSFQFNIVKPPLLSSSHPCPMFSVISCVKIPFTFVVVIRFELKHLGFFRGKVKCLKRMKHWSQGSTRKTGGQNESAALLPRDMRHTLSGSVAMFQSILPFFSSPCIQSCILLVSVKFNPAIQNASYLI